MILLTIAMMLVAVMMISCRCHVLTSPCDQMFLYQTLPYFISPHCNPKQNAHSKVKRYDIGEDSSDGENEFFSFDECVSSVVGGSWSITSKPDLFKSITKTCFNGLSRQPVLGRSIIGPVLNLHLAAPPRGDGSWRTSTPKNIVTQSLTMAVKALRLLWPAKVWMKLMGRVLVIQLRTRNHRHEILVTALLWFLLKWRNAWSRQSISKSNCYWERKSWL
jgi:hypothetical protein